MMQISTANPMMPVIPSKPELRHAFGRFATGIAVITMLDENGAPYGITVNSFTSVSMAPPILSWNVIRGSKAHATIARTRRFVVNILSGQQRHVAQNMAGPIESRFIDIDHSQTNCGMPIIEDTLATFECDVHSLITAGDHDIVLGTVNHFEHRDGRPLVYWKGGYATAADYEAGH